MSKATYYLWQDASNVLYITDYKEQKDGLTQIDGQGFIKVELLYSASKKDDVIKWALDNATGILSLEPE